MHHGPTDIVFHGSKNSLVSLLGKASMSLFQLKNTEDRRFLILCFSLLTNRSYLVKNVQLNCPFCKSVQK